jgi:hypothetical protein
MRHPRLPEAARCAALALALALAPRPAHAAPVQFLPVGDPLGAELRVLDLYAPSPGVHRIALPHLDATPLQACELLLPPRGDYAPWLALPTGARAIAVRRVLRALNRDASFRISPEEFPRPRLAEGAWPEGPVRLECSAGLEGERDALGGDADPATRPWRDGSGVHVRTGVQVDRWFAYSHLFFGELHGVRAFSDALVTGTDIAASTEESYMGYTAGNLWSAQLGRSRWSWGPGEEGTLLLSRTSAPLTGLMLHARIAPLHADGFVFNATVEPGRGEQLAAHRIEWQPRDWARLGVSEAARYQAGGWQGLYLAGVVPYAMVQKLLDQDHHDSTGALRNNVMVSLDASLRVADGSRIYGELLIDDLHARTAAIPNKYGWQAGWSGVGEVSGTRVNWNTEYTWMSRYVYTSFFGRSFAAQDIPLGFPTGPDSRRFRARVSWDPDTRWQLGAIAARTEAGEEGLADASVPGQPVPDVGTLAGTVERTRTLEGVLRWWPAGGVDLSLRAGREWTENAGHVAGAGLRRWRGALAFQLTR